MLGARLHQTAFYESMTSTLFTVTPDQLKRPRSYQNIITCSNATLKAWLLMRGVTDSISYNRKLKWLLYEGHRAEFTALAQMLSTMSELARKQYINGLSEHDKLKNKLICVNQFMNILTPVNIAALDYAQLIAMYKIGVRLRMCSLSEARSFSLEAAQISQTKYTSWHEYFGACIAGAYFESPPVDITSLNFIYTQKLLDATSIHPSVNWDRKLK
ncbi:hypothetical protein D3C81_899490 [compost metagenome]